MKVIDGKKIRTEIGVHLKIENEMIKRQNSMTDLSIVFIGEDKASQSFINTKKKFGNEFGFSVSVFSFNKNEDFEFIKNSILNLQKESASVIVQLPLPENLKDMTSEILQLIEDGKDVDNLNGKGKFISPIILSLLKVLDTQDLNSKIGVVGGGKVVGEPIFKYLSDRKSDVIKILEGQESLMKECDVLISCVGKPFFIKKENIKADAILVDYGCSYLDDKLCGDFDPECFENSKRYTPVPGGMGPIVVACLFENVLKAKK